MENKQIPKELKPIDEKKLIWELPKTYKKGMRVPARIYANEVLVKAMDPGVFDQVTNVATLPGIQKYAVCMPDGHWGYGFPIGGVAAFDLDEGVISPGGIGFDINCGVRLCTTNLTYKDVQPFIKNLTNRLFERVPAGVGSRGFVKLNTAQFKEVVEQGAKWCIEQGYGQKEDLERTEEDGCIKGADISKISDKAISRGLNQIGTLGSGNHYLEIQRVLPENIIDKEIAKKWGLFPDQIVIMFHCGSRGFGHQVASDYLSTFLNVMESKYKIKILDRELACAPFNSQEGQNYFAAMKGAVNMSFANRQVILHRIREVFQEIFKKSSEKLEINQLYDVAHNIAKVEEYNIDGKKKKVLTHRKGATRSFGPGNPAIPKIYRNDGQPVLIGGNMQSESYLLVGTKKAEEETFGSTCHGAGRTMSRNQAKRTWRGDKLQKDMEKQGIYVRTASFSGLAEEAGGAYKKTSDVINTVNKAGISKSIAKFSPIGNIKG
ncbi:MAG: RtcB family protein [Candidatus Woesearchaeota archaeon]